MDISAIYYDGWKDLVRIALAAPVIYFTIIAFIRLAGKRSTSQMNNFDWVVTVALGSIAGAGITSNSVTALEALFAILVLLGIQWALTFIIARNGGLEGLVKSSPRLLVYRGEYLEKNIRDERLTKSEVLAALRENGLTHVEAAEAVVLETDASFSVIARENASVSPEHLARSVRGVPDQS
ncbi:YetF domain-containing protein [uncultured Hyphomonas sp.]|jgi:uncharacterized membrane protein YcaP (DUF421 family)|uniref:DUF421 domain-containing protein n=1 Tax=uncultured Hyphomonas sp. TaxID=225298 RepID=UPI001A44CBBF|nr:DUF421 domain-containing protein [Hyphomonas sp.]|tara:strand:+ start:178 stop:720 length:543 start_codon:yes stop_codon:yes gene_type:complete